MASPSKKPRMSYDSDSECEWVDLSRTGELDGFLSDGWSTAERCSNAESATMLSSLSRVPSSLSVFSEASAAGTPKQNKGAYFRNRQPPCGSGQTCVRCVCSPLSRQEIHYPVWPLTAVTSRPRYGLQTDIEWHAPVSPALPLLRSYCFHEYLTGWSCGSYANCAECSE